MSKRGEEFDGRSKVGWIAIGTPSSSAFCQSASWSGWPWGMWLCVNGATKAPRAPDFTARSSSSTAAGMSSIESCAIGTSRPSLGRQKSTIQRL